MYCPTGMSRVSTLSWHVVHSESTDPTNLRRGQGYTGGSTGQNISRQRKQQGRQIWTATLLLLDMYRSTSRSWSSFRGSVRRGWLPSVRHWCCTDRTDSQGVNVGESLAVGRQVKRGVHPIGVALLRAIRIVRTPQAAPPARVARGILVKIAETAFRRGERCAERRRGCWCCPESARGDKNTCRHLRLAKDQRRE